jgi:hypothetical protein
MECHWVQPCAEINVRKFKSTPLTKKHGVNVDIGKFNQSWLNLEFHPSNSRKEQRGTSHSCCEEAPKSLKGVLVEVRHGDL